MKLIILPDLLTGRTLFENTWLHNPYKYIIIFTLGKKQKVWKLKLPLQYWTPSERKFNKRWGNSRKQRRFTRCSRLMMKLID